MILRLIEEVIAAAVGTMAFALMFHVPRQYYFCGGIAGGAGWLVYRALELHVDSLMGPVCAGAFTVVFLSRIFAVRKKCPVTMFLIPGIFPLVPGMGIYQTAQALVGSDWDLAAAKGLTSIKFAVAIVGGILLGFEIPQRCFPCWRAENEDQENFPEKLRKANFLRPFPEVSFFIVLFVQNRQHCFVKKHQDNGNKAKNTLKFL